jgi:hypothetical protein
MTLDLEVNEVEVKGLTSLASVTEITSVAPISMSCSDASSYHLESSELSHLCDGNPVFHIQERHISHEYALHSCHMSKRRDAELLDLLSRRKMYTFLYPLDACHPDPPAILPGNVYPNRTNS